METIQSPTQRASASYRRHNRVVMALTGLLAFFFILSGIGVLTGHVKVNVKNATVAADKPATQDCTKPTGKVGDLCAIATSEHGVVVTRTYVTQQFDDSNKRYAYLQDVTVRLHYADDATISNLCTAAAVATTTPDYSYSYQYKINKQELCDPAQKALSAGDSYECSRILDSAYGLAPLAFTPSNVDDACYVPAQPKGKSALVDTGSLLNDTPFYNDPSKDKSAYVPAA